MSLEGFKVGKWKIYSQSLDGQKLAASDWILPKKIPSMTSDISSKVIAPEEERTNILDVLNLETHVDQYLSSSGSQGGVKKQPRPHIADSHQSQELAELQLGKQNKLQSFDVIWCYV